MKLTKRHRQFGTLMADNQVRKDRAAAASRLACTTHGGRYKPEYEVWRSMRRRCYDAKAPAFKHYGGKGIAVCERWQKFENFYADMGSRPSADHSIDRFPNANGNYEPGNCRWATDKEQHRNRGAFNVLVEWRGRTLTIGEWVDVLGMPRDTVYWRLKHGWTPERAFTERVRLGRR